MKVNAKIELEMDELDGGGVVVQILKAEHKRLVDDCVSFLKKGKPTRPQAEDFNNNRHTAHCMEGILQYYMEHWAYDSWSRKHSVEACISRTEIDD